MSQPENANGRSGEGTSGRRIVGGREEGVSRKTSPNCGVQQISRTTLFIVFYPPLLAVGVGPYRLLEREKSCFPTAPYLKSCRLAVSLKVTTSTFALRAAVARARERMREREMMMMSHPRDSSLLRKSPLTNDTTDR